MLNKKDFITPIRADIHELYMLAHKIALDTLFGLPQNEDILVEFAEKSEMICGIRLSIPENIRAKMKE